MGNMPYHGPPQVILAYLKYQWSLGEELKRKESFARLQVPRIPSLVLSFCDPFNGAVLAHTF